MTGTVLHQSYMTQRPSLFALISCYAIVFSFALMFANGWFAKCDGFYGASACWLSHMKQWTITYDRPEQLARDREEWRAVCDKGLTTFKQQPLCEEKLFDTCNANGAVTNEICPTPNHFASHILYSKYIFYVHLKQSIWKNHYRICSMGYVCSAFSHSRESKITNDFNFVSVFPSNSSVFLFALLQNSTFPIRYFHRRKILLPFLGKKIIFDWKMRKCQFCTLQN